MQEDRQQMVPGGLIGTPQCRRSTTPALILALIAAAACALFLLGSCSSSDDPKGVSKRRGKNLRPCPRYSNYMPASLQTPCRLIDGKYYRAD
jgi:hypothetical protein